MGSEVNLVFRLEKLLASLGEPCGISDAVHAKLKGLLASRPLGDYELKGFEQKRSLFAVQLPAITVSLPAGANAHRRADVWP